MEGLGWKVNRKSAVLASRTSTGHSRPATKAFESKDQVAKRESHRNAMDITIGI